MSKGHTKSARPSVDSRARQKSVAVALIALNACHTPPPRYIVTASPIAVGAVAPPLCVAIDAHEPAGVWWWEPDRSGCAGRSTGPGVFRADAVRVQAGSRPESFAITFRLPRHAAPDANEPSAVDVHLVFEQAMLRSPESRVVVQTTRRNDLEIPESGSPQPGR